MKYLPLFFIFVKLTYFFNYKQIHRFQDNLKRYMDEKDNPNLLLASQLSPSICIFLLFSDILFLAYCIFLMFQPSTKTPGALLLFIDTLYTAAVYFHIKWAFTQDNQGYTYPAIWLRYLTFGASFFILINLYETM